MKWSHPAFIALCLMFLTVAVRAHAQTPFIINNTAGTGDILDLDSVATPVAKVNTNGAVLVAPGSSSAPSYSFLGDTGTGMYDFNPTDSVLALVSAGNYGYLQDYISGVGTASESFTLYLLTSALAAPNSTPACLYQSNLGTGVNWTTLVECPSGGPPPGWLLYYGDGTDGAITDSSATVNRNNGIYFPTTYTCSGSTTVQVTSANLPLVIVASQSITIGGSCTLSDAGNTSGTGDIGGGGGGGGGGALAGGTPGTGTKLPTNGAFTTVAAGGSAGSSGGGAGAAGSAPSTSQQRSFFMHGPYTPLLILGGSPGGAGGSAGGGAAGNGGGCIILIAPTITLASGATFTVSGAAGAAGGVNSGGGGGGGGGCIIIRSPNLTDSGASFMASGGGGGAAGSGTAGAGGNGGNGWSKKIPN